MNSLPLILLLSAIHSKDVKMMLLMTVGSVEKREDESVCVLCCLKRVNQRKSHSHHQDRLVTFGQ